MLKYRNIIILILVPGLLALLSCFGVAAAFCGWSHVAGWTAPPPVYLGVCPVQMRLDSLAAIFLLLLSLVSFSVSLFSPGYLEHLRGRVSPGFYWLTVYLFIASMAAVVLAANALTFLLFWEVMSLSSAALVAFDMTSTQAQKAALIYLGATRIATALLAAGFLWAHQLFDSWAFAGWNFGGPETLGPSVLIVLGFAVKAGLWPFHIWLPYAHPTAPSPVSALMSGVMIKIALYGILRLFAFQSGASLEIALLILFLGTVSAVWGVLFALVQRDLKRLLAYSSVENVGLIALGIGLYLYGHHCGLESIAAAGAVAALFHSLNHGLFKSLLFLGAGAIDASVHTRDLSHLGGLGRAMPWTLLYFVTGSAAITALPPLNGFASKWLIYQGLFQVAVDSGNLVHVGLAIAVIGILAVVGGLALACFTKAVGIAFLGRARSRAASEARECAPPMVLAQGLLAVLCLCLGMGSPWVGRLLSELVSGQFSQPFVPELPMVNLALALLLVAGCLYVAALARTERSLKKYCSWECGYGRLNARMQATGESFAQPIASLLRPVLQYRMRAEISGRDRRHFPEQVKAEAGMQSLLESRVYGPLIAAVRWLSAHMARLQAGSIHFYLLYLLVAVVSLLVAGVVL